MGCATSSSHAEGKCFNELGKMLGSSFSASPSSHGVSRDFHDCYRLGEKLGRGGFAQVRAATYVKSNALIRASVAVKIIDLRCKSDPSQIVEKRKKVVNEATLWLATKGCQHVVELYDVHYNLDVCYFVMEKCANNLAQHMDQLPEIDERSIGQIVREMLLGLSHVHSVGVIHRDVKPDNFIVGGSDGSTVKLIDFGLSVGMPKEEEVLITYGGTAPFMSPEMITGKPYGERTDVWSLGVLVYLFFFGEFPYISENRTPQSIRLAIAEGRQPRFQPMFSTMGNGQELSASAGHFVRELLDRDADRRPLADDALRLPYINDIRENCHMIRSMLPSLRPNFHAAKRAGAFEYRNLTKISGVDSLLNKLQMEKYGNPLPEVFFESTLSAKASNIPLTNLKNTIGNSSAWRNTSSIDTTASRGSSSPPAPSASDWSELNSVPHSLESSKSEFVGVIPSSFRADLDVPMNALPRTVELGTLPRML